MAFRYFLYYINLLRYRWNSTNWSHPLIEDELSHCPAVVCIKLIIYGTNKLKSANVGQKPWLNCTLVSHLVNKLQIKQETNLKRNRLWLSIHIYYDTFQALWHSISNDWTLTFQCLKYWTPSIVKSKPSNSGLKRVEEIQ